MPEQWRPPGVYSEEAPNAVRAIAGVPTSITAFVGAAPRGPVDEPVVVTGFEQFRLTFGGLWEGSRLGFAVRDFFLNGGAAAVIVRLVDPSELAGDIEQKRGLYALEKADLFNLLVVPPAADAGASTDAMAAAAAYCERRRAILLVDPPLAWNAVDDVLTGLSAGFVSAIGTSSKNTALFFPHLRQPDPLSGGAMQTFSPSGAVAGVIARTDAQRGVWKAPAGLDATLKGVSGLSASLTDRDIDLINSLGVNGVRELPRVGHVVWGARTMQGADSSAGEWRYLSVRRTALFIEESVSRGTQWVVFEPNDEALWAQIRLSVGAFMHDLFRQGAFRGATPREAYFVRCDRETTTPADIERGIVNIHVGFAALKPGEFVVIHLKRASGPTAVEEHT